MTDPTQALLLYFIMPLWFLAGLADWLCHRATDIEHTTGPKESLLHLLMFAEIAVPLLACLFLEINAAIFLLMIVSFLAHEATALWDVSYAAPRRYVSPIEQHVHSFLEMIPLLAGVIVAVRHWAQLPAVFGLGAETARFEITLKVILSQSSTSCSCLPRRSFWNCSRIWRSFGVGCARPAH